MLKKYVALVIIACVASALVWRARLHEWSGRDYEVFTKTYFTPPSSNRTMGETLALAEVRLERNRLAVICYVPVGLSQVFYFLSLLYGSWRHIIDKRGEMFSDPRNDRYLLDIDLLVFCHPLQCPHLEAVCELFKEGANEVARNRCWSVLQSHEISLPYGPINSFVMFNRTDIYHIMKPYKYILRTDFDVFLTPALFLWRPHKRLIAGHGGYCADFNRKRLPYIAKKLNLIHRGITCVGSTWYGETDLFIRASKKTIELTAYLFMNEFTPNATGLESVDFVKNREGEWPKWWRPVSSMYGAELALNHLIDDFSEQYIGELDTPSCSQKSIWQSPHVHCWHSDCEFQKFKFMTQLTQIIEQRETLPAKVVRKILQNTYSRPVQNMTISTYSTYIAWHSVASHFRKWFL